MQVERPASNMMKAVGEMRRPALEPARLDILVVEDNPVNQLAAEQIFGSMGLEFRLANNGCDGLAQIAKQWPALIFADVTLPDMTFEEFSRSAQTMYGQGRNQPAIVALLSKQALGLHPQFNNEAIGDTIMKPLSPDSIDQMIRKHVLEFVDSADAFSKTAA
jgi:CheY-like chemotaxis protein